MAGQTERRGNQTPYSLADHGIVLIAGTAKEIACSYS